MGGAAAAEQSSNTRGGSKGATESSNNTGGRNLAFTRYCHHQYGMVYGIQKGGRWGVVYCAIDVQ